MSNGIALDARLRALAEMVEPCHCAADIGADHGLLGAWLLLSGRAERVQFLDISSKSLDKARRLIGKLGLDARASFSVGDGALALLEAPDAVVIAGMGGQLIADIVENGLERIRRSQLVLQPNVAAMELRERLMRLGFLLEHERIVRAHARLYVALSARAGRACYDKRELLVGPCLLREGDPLLRAYAERRLNVAVKALSGARLGGARSAELEWECAVWEEIMRGERTADL